jgi:hypothetical protein
VDASRIHPDDRLIEDLGFAQMDGLDANWLELDVAREFGVSIHPHWAAIHSVRGLVSCIARVTASGGGELAKQHTEYA